MDYPGVIYALNDAEPWELRSPLAEFGPTNLTRALKLAVLAYFREEVSPSASIFAHDPFSLPETPESAEAEAEAEGGGPRTVVVLEECAAAALKALAAANPGARMFRDGFRTAVAKFMSKVAGGERFSMAAATRAWRKAAPDEWTVAGAPGNKGHSLTADDLVPHLRKALEVRLGGQGPIPEPPAGSDWEGLIKS